MKNTLIMSLLVVVQVSVMQGKANSSVFQASIDQALIAAVWKNNWKRVEGLIDEGANINYSNGIPPSTALMGAAYCGYTEVAKVLIKKLKRKKMKINFTGSNELTPVQWAQYQMKQPGIQPANYKAIIKLIQEAEPQ